MLLRKIKSGLLISVCGFCLSFMSISGTASASETERIDNFDAVIQINADASLDIEERIDYDFGASTVERHGIYRNIPIRYDARGGNYSLRMSDISVTDGKYIPYEFQVSRQGKDQVIKIGSADISVSGKKVYVIRYKIKRAINYFDTHDELYWNVTGNGWEVPIDRVSARVMYPRNLEVTDTEVQCYSGYFGGKNPCAAATYIYVNDVVAAGADFSAVKMGAGEGLTVLAGMPKGVLYQPTRYEYLIEDAKDNLIIFLPLLVFMIMYVLWWKRGRDPKGRGTIIPEFDVPDRLTPVEIGTIVDERCGQKEVVAEIIHLAVQGYLKLKRTEKKVLFVKSTEYTFEKLKDSVYLADKFDQDLMDGIFKKGPVVELSDLKETFYKDYAKVKQGVFAAVFQKGYFVEDPRKVIGKYMFLAVAVFLLFYLLPFFGGAVSGAYGVSALVISLVIILIFAGIMPRKTERGVLAKEHILGLKDYLEVAEKDRLEFHNAPAKSPEEFEKLLPYAIALGVEKEWAKQFEGIYDSHPSWYEDSRGFNSFNAVLFASSLGDFKTSFASGAMTSASSGGSGLGGGGFSGGGFGGGGGGSW